jgi:eukaryotic-like serine/threonine-protein kinase
MGMKPVLCAPGLLAASLLLTGCETTSSPKTAARTTQPLRPYASTTTPPSTGRTAWDSNPPPTPGTTASVGPVAPAGFTSPSAKNDNYGPPVNGYQTNTRTAQANQDSVRLTAPTRGLAEPQPNLPRQTEQAAVTPPPVDPPLLDSKPTTPPSSANSPSPSAPDNRQPPSQQ